MLISITIQHVPDETHNEPAVRGSRTGQSLQQQLGSRLVDLARQAEAERLVARIRAHKAATGSTSSAEQILSHLDEDRR